MSSLSDWMEQVSQFTVRGKRSRFAHKRFFGIICSFWSSSPKILHFSDDLVEHKIFFPLASQCLTAIVRVFWRSSSHDHSGWCGRNGFLDRDLPGRCDKISNPSFQFRGPLNIRRAWYFSKRRYRKYWFYNVRFAARESTGVDQNNIDNMIENH